jgi:hypothetical protein
MTQHQSDTIQKQWARLRFSIVGSLMHSPPPPGELKRTLAQLAARDYLNPATGLPVQFVL